jgi:hypothetical protein
LPVTEVTSPNVRIGRYPAERVTVKRIERFRAKLEPNPFEQLTNGYLTPAYLDLGGAPGERFEFPTLWFEAGEARRISASRC